MYVEGMNLVVFHQNLFGSKALDRTPKEVRVTPQQRRLYKGFPYTRGFSVTPKQAKDWKNQERFLSAPVMTLGQTEIGENRSVYLFMPQFYVNWAEDQIQKAARYVLQRRRGNLAGKEAIRDIFQQMDLGGVFGRMAEPEHWATFGFCSKGVLPEWIGRRLIRARNE